MKKIVFSSKALRLPGLEWFLIPEVQNVFVEIVRVKASRVLTKQAQQNYVLGVHIYFFGIKVNYFYLVKPTKVTG